MQNFNYHQHTYRCKHADFNMTDEDYVQEYLKMGIKKIAFTDHCPEKNLIDKRPKMRMDYDKRGEYLESINDLKRKYAGKIDIKLGYEVEYLPGEEENLYELKNETDLLILGQHFIYDEDKNLNIILKNKLWKDEDKLRYAEYIQKAVELGIPDIIAHPDLFMICSENFGEVENRAANIICKVAEKYNIPLEINLNKIFASTYFDYPNKVLLPYKPVEEQISNLENVKYPCKEFWEVASKYDIRVLYGIDSHFRGQVLLFKELIELANNIIGKETIKKLNFVSDFDVDKNMIQNQIDGEER